jgi:putative membrane protein
MIGLVIIGVILGIFFGTLTGLFPGIHINLVAAGLLASIGYFSGIESIVLVVFVVAMAVTHTFVDFIPSVFLGAPEEDSFLSVLPGHQMLREGKGHEAIVLTLYGSLIALAIVIVFSFVFIWILPLVFDFFQIVMPFVLIFVSLYLVLREDEFIQAFVIFLLAGFLGLLTFNLPVKEPLLPLLSGLFGVSGLIVSVKSKFVIPKQKIEKLRKIKLKRRSFWKGTLAAAIAAPFSSFMPGMGAGHAAVISSEIMGEQGKDKRGFLFLVGAINTIVMALSFVTIYAIGRTRTGAAVAVQEILGEITLGNLFIILVVVIVSGTIAFLISVNLSKIFSRGVGKVSYTKLSFGIIGLLLIVNLVLTNFLGLIVLVTASALGVFSILSRARRINLMGALLVPTILFYLRL